MRIESLASTLFTIPSTVRISNAFHTIWITFGTSTLQRDLFDKTITGNIKSFVLLGNGHGSDRLQRTSGFNDIQKLRFVLSSIGIVPTSNFENSTITGSSIVNSVFLALTAKMWNSYFIINNELGEGYVSLVKCRSFGIMWNIPIHQRMFSNEIEYSVGEISGILNASSWTRFGNAGRRIFWYYYFSNFFLVKINSI